MNPPKWAKNLFLQAFPPNEPKTLSRKPIFAGFFHRNELKSILGDPPGLNWIQIRETFGGTPPILDTLGSQPGQKFQKTATFRTSRIPKKKDSDLGKHFALLDSDEKF